MQANVFTDIVTAEGDAKAGYATVAVTRGVKAAASVVVTVSVVGIFFNYIPYVLGIVGVAFAIVISAEVLERLYMAQSLIRKPTVANVRSLMWTAAFMPFCS